MPITTAPSEPDRAAKPDKRQQLDDAVIAPRPTRRYRAAAFQAYVLSAAVVFVVLAVVAHSVAYFSMDLTITKAVQSYWLELAAL